jgi:predicted dehydrogenase
MAVAPTYPAQPTIWESEVIGTLGMGRLRNRQWAQMSNRTTQIHQETQTTAKTLGEHYNFVRQAAAFVEAIVTETAPPVSGEDGLAALEIVLAIYAAARTGERVAVA